MNLSKYLAWGALEALLVEFDSVNGEGGKCYSYEILLVYFIFFFLFGLGFV